MNYHRRSPILIYKQELNKTQRYAVSILVLDLIYVDTTKT